MVSFRLDDFESKTGNNSFGQFIPQAPSGGNNAGGGVVVTQLPQHRLQCHQCVVQRTKLVVTVKEWFLVVEDAGNIDRRGFNFYVRYNINYQGNDTEPDFYYSW